LWSRPSYYGGEQDNRCGIFGVGLPPPWSRGADCDVKQASNALRVSNGNRTVHANIILTSVCGARPLVSTITGALVKYGYLVTHSWMKMLWEKLSMFDMHVVVADKPQEFPREGDQFIMQVLIRAGYTRESLSCLNRV
jgi:hypothetical protein